MYTLRKITKDFVYNESLGSGYTVVDREFNKEKFEHYYKSVFGNNSNKESHPDLIKFVVTSYVTPIYRTESVYVMTDSGKTFECLNKC